VVWLVTRRDDHDPRFFFFASYHFISDATSLRVWAYHLISTTPPLPSRQPRFACSNGRRRRKLLCLNKEIHTSVERRPPTKTESPQCMQGRNSSNPEALSQRLGRRAPCNRPHGASTTPPTPADRDAASSPAVDGPASWQQVSVFSRREEGMPRRRGQSVGPFGSSAFPSWGPVV